MTPSTIDVEKSPNSNNVLILVNKRQYPDGATTCFHIDVVLELPRELAVALRDKLNEIL